MNTDKKHPYPNPSYEDMKPKLFELFERIDRELLKFFIDRAYTEWYNQPDK